MKDHDPEIVVLTETKVKKSGVEEIIENLPFNSFEVVDPVGLSGGILILWNSGVNSITTVTKDRRFITRLFRAVEFWNRVPCPSPIPSSTSWEDWLSKNLSIDIMSMWDIPWNVLFCFALWHLWLRRNAWSFSKINISLPSSIHQCIWLLRNHKKEAGCAVVCRDSSGQWVIGLVWRGFLAFSYDAELKAIEMAMNLIQEKGWTSSILCSDAKRAIEEVTSADPILNAPSLISKCRALQMELHLDMRFEPRESNAVVDILAKDARCHLQDLNQICILDHMPVICGEAFVRDLSNCTELSVSTDAGDVPAETSCNVTFN
uniref:RNase H type-1 domain-containing protein n=1 Tax=Chenopodium quinoa TaxID=63459 RepID=A0A803M008_CHEQI